MSAPRELPSTLKLTILWLVLFTLLFLGFKAWEHQRQQSRFSLRQGEIVLQRSDDGHFHWRGRIAGREMDFLVDTGASHTTLPEPLARELGLPWLTPMQSSTAGGQANGYWSRADLALDGGVQVQALRVGVLPRLDTPLLGMDLLGRLAFTQQGGELRIAAPR